MTLSLSGSEVSLAGYSLASTIIAESEKVEPRISAAPDITMWIIVSRSSVTSVST